MTWLAVADHDERRLSLRGLGVDKLDTPVCPDHPTHLLTCGTLMFETRMSPDGGPQVLFGYKNTHPWHRSLVFQAIPGGGVAMVQVQGKDITHAAIQHRNSGRTDVLRITYTWDSTNKWGRLTLEKPGDTTLITAPVHAPRPLALQDLRDLMLGRGDQTMSTDVIFAALSNRIEPVGPMPTITPDTPVLTPWGYRAIGTLQRGDTVTTQGGDVVPVLQTVSRTVPARGSYQPLRIRAPYFDLQQDVTVAPDQRLVISGPEVEYQFNKEAVLMPARHLLNGFSAIVPPSGPTATYTQLILPGHDTLIAAGGPLESLYIGRLRRNADQMASSLLAGFNRSLLPEHGRAAHPVLQWYEAITLAKRRAA